jgi:two-component system, chemotaxis family, protein-glutamate methylesterase/glutaminase
MQPIINAEEEVRDVVVIGASAGGIAALGNLLSLLPADLRAFIGVVIHRGARSSANWAGMLGRRTRLRTREPFQGEPSEYGTVYIAPSDKHMTFSSGAVLLDYGMKQNGTRPAVDPLFASAAQSYGRRVVGVVLSGGGRDGTQGLVHISKSGGVSIVQSPIEAEHSSMPANAMAHDHVQAVLTLDEIAAAVIGMAAGRALDVGAQCRPLQAQSPHHRIGKM